jgi:ribosomal protein L15
MPDQKKKAPGHRGTGAPKAKAAGKTGGKLRVTQVRSKSGRPALHKRTLIALGLRHHQQVIEVNDSPANPRPGFEGGQMPLIRRVPKRGFTNTNKVVAQVVNLKSLADFANGDVTAEKLSGAGLVQHADRVIKLLSDGEAPQGLVVKGLKVSAAAKAKIEAAGGRVEE